MPVILGNLDYFVTVDLTAFLVTWQREHSVYISLAQNGIRTTLAFWRHGAATPTGQIKSTKVNEFIAVTLNNDLNLQKILSHFVFYTNRNVIAVFIVLCPVWCLPHYLTNGTIFEKRVGEYKMCVLSFSTTFVWNISRCKNNSTRYYHKCT